MYEFQYIANHKVYLQNVEICTQNVQKQGEAVSNVKYVANYVQGAGLSNRNDFPAHI